MSNQRQFFGEHPAEHRDLLEEDWTLLALVAHPDIVEVKAFGKFIHTVRKPRYPQMVNTYLYHAHHSLRYSITCRARCLPYASHCKCY